MPNTDQTGGPLVVSALKSAQKTDKGTKGKHLKTFIEEYFAHVPVQDLEGMSGAGLAGMAR